MPANKTHILLVFGAISKKWSPPKGGLELGETYSQGAKRECHEETGLCVNFPDNSEHLNIRKQHYFCLTTIDDSILELPLKPWDVREIEKARWLTWDEVNTLPPENCNAITLEIRKPTTRTKIINMSIISTVVVGEKPVQKAPVGLEWD